MSRVVSGSSANVPAWNHRATLNDSLTLDVRDNFLLELWNRVRRQRKRMALLGLCGLGLGIAYSLIQKPEYQASAVIEIHELNQDFMNLKSVSPLSIGPNDLSVDDVQTYIRKLESSSILYPVIERLGMAQAPVQTGLLHRIRSWVSKPPAVDRLEMSVSRAQASLRIEEIGRSRLIEIGYSASDPKLASAFPNALAAELLTENLQSRGVLSQDVSKWIAVQLGEMRAKLIDSERALEDYTRTSGMIFVGPASGTGSDGSQGASLSGEKLREVQTELSQAEADRMNKEAQYDLAQSSPPETLPFLAGDNLLRAQGDKLVDLKRQQAELGLNYKPTYSGMRSLTAQIDVLEKAIAQERQTILRQIRNDYMAAVERERLLNDKYRSQSKTVAEEGVKSVQYQMLRREVESNRQLYDELLQRTKQASVAAALQANNITVVDAAKVPLAPSKPNLPINAAAGLLGGLGLGALCISVFTKKSTITRPGELKSIAGVSELGAIQTLRKENSRRHWRQETSLQSPAQKLLDRFALLDAEQQPTAIAHSYRSVLTSLRLTGGKCRVLAFTSPSAIEGKTTVISGLSVVLAEMKQRVLVIDGDMYKPTLHQKLDGHNERGLLDVLQEANLTQERLPEFIQRTAIPKLDLMASGRKEGSIPLLFSSRLRELLEKCRLSYDFILIDTPPMLEIAEARILGKVSDGVILVIRADQTTRESAVAAIERMNEDGIPVLGTVLNDWDPASNDLAYGLYYGRRSEAGTNGTA